MIIYSLGEISEIRTLKENRYVKILKYIEHTYKALYY